MWKLVDIGDPLRNVLIALFVILLIRVAYYTYRRTKQKVRTGLLGNSAIFLGSLFSAHSEILKEVRATIRNKVKKTDPQDKD